MKNYGVTVLFLAALTAACSSSSSGGGVGASTPVAPADFPAQAAASICDNIGSCCMTAGYAYDDAACRTYETKQAAGSTATTMLDGVSWDANQAGACIALLAQIAAQCTATDDQIKQLDTTCGAVTVGTKPEGAACTSSDQCAAPAGSKAYCPVGGDVPSGAGGGAGSTAAVCTVSAPAVHAKQGEGCNASCDSTEGDCTGTSGAGGAGSGPTGTCYASDGLTCSFTTFTCQPQSAIGGDCLGSNDCVSGATCSSGKCAAKGNAGDACPGSFGACSTGNYCDATTQKCVAQLPAGSACDTNNYEQCASGYCSEKKCVPNGQLASKSICNGSGSSSTPGGAGGSDGGSLGSAGAGTGTGTGSGN